ncbi:hypothetical protein GEMRC1_012784 [Eukaryota sp. GEM-RC1]
MEVEVERNALDIFTWLRDQKNKKLVEPSVTELNVLKELEDGLRIRFCHIVYKLVFPLANREAVVAMFEGKEGDVFVLGASSVELDKVPEVSISSSKSVWSTVNVSGHVVIPLSQKKSKLVTMADVNPGGKIPTWSINWAAEHRLKQQVELGKLLEKHISK